MDVEVEGAVNAVVVVVVVVVVVPSVVVIVEVVVATVLLMTSTSSDQRHLQHQKLCHTYKSIKESQLSPEGSIWFYSTFSVLVPPTVVWPHKVHSSEANIIKLERGLRLSGQNSPVRVPV